MNDIASDLVVALNLLKRVSDNAALHQDLNYDLATLEAIDKLLAKYPNRNIRKTIR